MASLIGLIVVVIWAVNFIAAKIGLRSFAADHGFLSRLCRRRGHGSFLSLPQAATAVCVCRSSGRPELGFTRRDIWTFLYLGFFGVSVNQFCFTLGLHYTSVNHSAAMVGMGPIYTLILAVLLRLERAPWHKAVGMAFAFTGIAVLATEGGISARSPSLLGHWCAVPWQAWAAILYMGLFG
jgi:drug/metabolite transporter (DMT)-like permease